MLWCNMFADGTALLECEPQGDASAAVKLPETDEAILAVLIGSPEISAALARLFLAGVTAGERAVNRR
jgi:hypothetical protein